MTHSERIKTAVERDIKAISLRPSIALGKENMTVTAGSDARCKVRDGDQTMDVDLGSGHGGDGTTPGPGFLVRAALGTCVTQAYVIFAASLDIQVDRVTVEIQTDYDATKGLGLEGGGTCGYTNVRLLVEVESPASHAEIERIAEMVEQRDFMWAVFTEAHRVERELRVTRAAAA